MDTSTLSVARLLDRLLEYGREPSLYAPGTHPLWTDEHISRGMLAAHLDPGTDVASRRLQTIDATVAWLAGRLPAGARVLDLGCGPGLYTRRLAQAGFDVVGVDFSARSIEYARFHGGPVRYLCGDYRTVGLEGTFDAVLLIYLDLGTFSPQDARRILQRVRGWLAPGGVFVFRRGDPRVPGRQRTSPRLGGGQGGLLGRAAARFGCPAPFDIPTGRSTSTSISWPLPRTRGYTGSGNAASPPSRSVPNWPPPV